jgi:hypothetical protein
MRQKLMMKNVVKQLVRTCNPILRLEGQVLVRVGNEVGRAKP